MGQSETKEAGDHGPESDRRRLFLDMSKFLATPALGSGCMKRAGI
jgi:hypothetical protein